MSIGCARRMSTRRVLQCKLKMASSSSIPVTICFFMDGRWLYQSMQLIPVPFFVCSPSIEEHDVEGRNEKRANRRKAPPPPPSSQDLEDVLEALCAASSNGHDTSLPVLRNLTVRFVGIPLLSSFRVDGGERFGSKLAHWCRLIEMTESPNLVVYFSAERAFFLISAKSSNNQQVETRSAICWLRDCAGLGFCFDEEHGVLRIRVSRCLLSDEDPCGEGLARLLSSLSDVFPGSTSEES